MFAIQCSGAVSANSAAIAVGIAIFTGILFGLSLAW